MIARTQSRTFLTVRRKWLSGYISNHCSTTLHSQKRKILRYSYRELFWNTQTCYAVQQHDYPLVVCLWHTASGTCEVAPKTASPAGNYFQTKWNTGKLYGAAYVYISDTTTQMHVYYPQSAIHSMDLNTSWMIFSNMSIYRLTNIQTHISSILMKVTRPF